MRGSEFFDSTIRVVLSKIHINATRDGSKELAYEVGKIFKYYGEVRKSQTSETDEPKKFPEWQDWTNFLVRS